VIAPWDVDDLPEEWLLAAQEIAGGKKKQAVHQAEDMHVKNVFTAWRRNHPAYRNV